MKKILLLILVTFVFNSCVDASPNIEAEAHNDIHITIDGENLDGFIGEWKITSEEKETHSAYPLNLKFNNWDYTLSSLSVDIKNKLLLSFLFK